MPTGLYFGSFNPIHNGHLIIANHILNETAIKKIWFVISPQNPFKKGKTLLNEFDRLHLVQKAIANDIRMKAVDIEFSLPKPSYTATTLNYLSEKYPMEQFQVIMGSDSFQNLANWHNADFIIKNYQIVIYKRPKFEVVNNINAAIQVMQAPLLEISATYIRQLVTEGKSIRYLIPDIVEEEIKSNRFFKH
jgi:nicotinate-nucleotide adenylyltransferase